MSELRDWLVETVKTKGYRFDADGFVLASGKVSHHFIDGKLALSHGDDLTRAAQAVAEVARGLGVEFDAVGGLTNGADHLAHAVAMVTHTSWFFVRKEAKQRGTKQRLEGARLGPTTRVLLVDDVVTTGGSILEALEVVQSEAGATVVGAIPLVERDDAAREEFGRRGIAFDAAVSYRDLGIPKVSEEDEDPADWSD
jgi:orotate phosphoribosyltransferase